MYPVAVGCVTRLFNDGVAVDCFEVEVEVDVEVDVEEDKKGGKLF